MFSCIPPRLCIHTPATGGARTGGDAERRVLDAHFLASLVRDGGGDREDDGCAWHDERDRL